MKITLEVDMSNYQDTKVLLGSLEQLLEAILKNKDSEAANK
jgi:hypothetical protein